MNKIFAIVIICFGLNKSIAQTVNKNLMDGEVYVKFTKGSLKEISKENPKNIPIEKLSLIRPLIAKYGINKVIKPFYLANDDEKLPYILKLEFSEIAKIDSLIEELNTISGVEYAEGSPIYWHNATPNDPTFGAHLTQINANNAWNVFNSTANGNSTITIAVVDDAIDRSHPDLAPNIYTNPLEIAGNGIDDDKNGYVDDVNGWDVGDNDNNTIPTNTLMSHGTHCTGIAGARTDNGIGVASIGWNIKLIPVKCQIDGGSTTQAGDTYSGMFYAAKIKAKIISCSFGSTVTTTVLQNIVDYAWNRGCIVICAAGNNNSNVPSYPAACNNAFCVASVNGSDVKSTFSSFGSWVDIAAPGENIISTTPGNTYQLKSGTSMSTPLVSGLAALMLSKYPTMTQTDVLNCLSSNATNIYSLAGNTAFASGNQLGAGRIDAFASMNCAAAFFNNPPIANFFTLTRGVCPNTPVSFIDSSLYLPTSYAWTFQGGTPATSTSSNPSVQWSSPGVYSVSLVATNANGSSTKVKNSYIFVAGPISLPLNEGFEGPQFFPPNWTTYNVNNDANFWQGLSGLGGFGTSNVCIAYNNFNIDVFARDEIRTPKYIFNGVASARLRFDVAYKQFDAGFFSDTVEVKVSTNCGTNWTSIYNKGGASLSTSPGVLTSSVFIPSASEWRRDTIDVSTLTAGQSNIMFSFVNRGHNGQTIFLDNINLVFPTPTVSFNLPATVCVGNNVNFVNTSVGAASYTWTMPGGTVTNSNLQNTQTSYLSPGIYSITLVAANGTTTASITQTITVIALPAIAVTSSVICIGGSAILSASGANTYTWNPGGLTGATQSFSPLSAQVYTVTGSNGTCSNSGTATLSVLPSPTVTVNNATICNGKSAIITASGASSYTWNPGGLSGSTQTLSPVSSSVYTLIGANGSCTNTKNFTITVLPNPTIIVSNTTICSGGSAILNASGASSFTWNPGNLNGTSQTVNPNATQVYSVIGNNGTCSASINVTVTVLPLPIIAVTSSVICIGGSAVLSASGANTYTWNPGGLVGTTQTFNPLNTQVYTVIGNDGFCSNIGTGTLSVLPSPTLSLSNATLCSGASTVITANGASSYTWYPGALVGASQTLNPLVTTIYTVTGVNGTCADTESFTLTLVSGPNIVVTNTTVCSGVSAILSASGANSYTWNPGGLTGSSQTFNPLSTQVYTVVGDDGTCTNSSTGVFNVLPLPVIAVTSTVICPGDVAILSASGANTYTWNPGGLFGPTQTFNALNTQVYTVIGDDGTCSNTGTATLSVLPSPTISVNSATICNGSTNLVSANGASSYTWNPGGLIGSSQNLSPVVTTIYTVSGANGSCVDVTNFTLSVIASPTISILASSSVICIGSSITLSASGAITYTTNPGTIIGNSITVSPTSSTNYTVIGEGTNGCNASSVVSVSVSLCTNIQSKATDVFAAYPNPTEGITMIEFAEEFSGDVTLYNSMGQLISHQSVIGKQKVDVDLSYYARGVYWIKLLSNTSKANVVKVIRD